MSTTTPDSVERTVQLAGTSTYVVSLSQSVAQCSQHAHATHDAAIDGLYAGDRGRARSSTDRDDADRLISFVTRAAASGGDDDD